MEITGKIIYSTLLTAMGFLLLSNNSRAQAIDTTIKSANTTGNYTASHSITLGVGFTANGALGAFSAKIVPGPLFNCGVLGTPSAGQNYIQTLTPRQPFTDPATLLSQTICAVNQGIQYFDALGRPIQTVNVKANSNGTRDVIQPMAYDHLGRESVKYLPYTTTGASGSYRGNALTNTNGRYTGSEQFAFYQLAGQGYGQITSPSAPTAFELSELDRPQEQGAPGDYWQLTGTVNPSGKTSGHTIKTIYTTNDGTTYWAKQFGVTINATTGAIALTDQGSYVVNQLYVTINRNENWLSTQTDLRLNTTEEYKDKVGHVILKRTFNSKSGATEVLSTYYVYDDYGNLTYVLPPLANADAGLSSTGNPTVIANLCYQYTYDDRNHVATKQIPGTSAPTYTVYNTLDQVVATQDANQRAQNQWLITKYDALGRAVITGIWTNGNTAIDPATLRNRVYGQTQQWELKDNSQVYGYTLTRTYPTTLDNVLTVNYYDDYSFPVSNPYAYAVDSQISPAMPATASIMTKGLMTGSLIAILNGTSNHTSLANMLWTVNYYDDKGRAIQIQEQHYLGGTVNAANHDVVSSGYDFTNAVIATNRKHYTIAGGATPVVNIANSYVYDQIGRRRQAFEQINGGTNVLLSQVDFNEMGQNYVKHQHSVNGGASFLQNNTYAYNERSWLTNLTGTSLFAMQLDYTNGTAPKFNGDIVQQSWGLPGALGNTYTYSYDNLDRLTDGIASTGYSEKTIGYDKAGNIQTLTRTTPSSSSPAAYTYSYPANSNQLTSVSGITTGNYTYDPNGNVKYDAKNNITVSAYNYLNLPQTITGSKSITYIYDASGKKLRRIGATTTDYVNGIQYEQNQLAFIQTEEGRALPTGATPGSSSYNYEYNMADQLGNTRVTFDTQSGTANQVQANDYYPFGLSINTGSPTGLKNNYLYNNKELQEDLGQYDYGARFYDPVIGRFGMVDPMAEANRRFSPYAYADDNPIRNIDPDGMETIDAQGNIYSDSPAEAQQKFLLFKIAYSNWIKNGGGKKKGKQSIPKLPTQSSPSWVYKVPVWGEAAKAGDSWQDGNYGQSAIHEVTGFLELALFAESRVVSAYEAVSDYFAKEATVDLPTILNKGSEFGRMIGWGKQGIEGVHQTMNVTGRLTEKQVEQWIKRGLTKEWVEEQLANYNATFAAGGKGVANNDQLIPRTYLMRRILALWPK